MSENETELYQFQLEQVEHALSSDPNNEELLKLQTDLKELIALTTQYEQVSSTTPSSSNPTDQANNNDNNTSLENTRKRSRSPSSTSSPAAPKSSALVSHQFSVGQDVKAKWSQDGQYYRATITAIGGADQIFSVQFRGYKDIEVVSVADIEPLEKDKRKGIFEDIKTTPGVDSDTNVSNNNVGVSVGDDGTNNMNSNKKKKVKKVSEVEVKKNAWLDFAKGGDKKKKKKQTVLPINKKSIFRTPDNPESKVGVVGSGRGMTSYQQRGKHFFNNSIDDQ